MKQLIALALAAFLLVTSAHAADAPHDRAQKVIDRALNFLEGQQQPDGSWQRPSDPPAVTAIVLRAFARNPQADPPFMKKGFDKLMTYQKPDGGFYEQVQANYNTAIVISLLAESKNPDLKPHIDRAVAFLKGLQWNERPGESKERAPVEQKDPRFGGWGYGRSARPDLSNAQIAIEALHDAGLDPSDKAYQAALVFITRTQNNSETNDQPWTGDD